MKDILKIIDLLDRAIKENPEISLTSGEIIADFYNDKIDEYRNIINNSKNWLVLYQNKLIDETNILNLKVKYTSVFGYFIEVTKSHTYKVPDYFIPKQTLVWANRYVTQELKEFEEKFLEAEENKNALEYEIFQEVREEVLKDFSDIKTASNLCSNVDFLSSLANVAYENSYKRPEITDSYDLTILAWKHPVIQKSTSDFISNNLELTSDKFVHIITGPNMWGKSTFLRQNALIILMAHIWSFVPATKAIIPITDKIFSRIWASDNLYFGQSTFMVEMQEVANILNNSTKNSFVIIDEVGRWTSTYDGMSIAWAILKENHDKIKAKTLFATHFHELIDESKKLHWVGNFSVAVGENEENLIFLRKIVSGWIKKSFWLEVARIAWLWEDVIKEARKMLKLLEEEHNETFWNQLSLVSLLEKPVSSSKSEEIKKESELEKELEKIDVNSLTPIEALNELFRLKKIKK